MNQINASKRLKESAYQRAEGEKILKVKKAEAEAESMYLSGLGVAKQRRAIMDGLKYVSNIMLLNIENILYCCIITETVLWISNRVLAVLM
jgi:hypothetical protein